MRGERGANAVPGVRFAGPRDPRSHCHEYISEEAAETGAEPCPTPCPNLNSCMLKQIAAQSVKSFALPLLVLFPPGLEYSKDKPARFLKCVGVVQHSCGRRTPASHSVTAWTVVERVGSLAQPPMDYKMRPE